MEQLKSLLQTQQAQIDELVVLVLLQGELLNKLCEPLTRHEQLCQELYNVQQKVLGKETQKFVKKIETNI
jgi:hypothetical protein